MKAKREAQCGWVDGVRGVDGAVRELLIWYYIAVRELSLER